MKKLRIAACALAVVAATSACSNLTKEQMGTGVGASVGVIAGRIFGKTAGQKNVLAVVLGVAGGYVGNRIGAYLDEEDRKRLAENTMAVLDNQAPVAAVAAPADEKAGTAKPKKKASVRAKSFTAKTGAMVEVYESDANGRPKASASASTKNTTAKGQPDQAPVKNSVIASVPSGANQSPVATESTVAQTKPATDDAKIVKVSTNSAPPPIGDCKYVTQRLSMPDGTTSIEPKRFCKEPPAPGSWKPVEA